MQQMLWVPTLFLDYCPEATRMISIRKINPEYSYSRKFLKNLKPKYLVEKTLCSLKIIVLLYSSLLHDMLCWQYIGHLIVQLQAMKIVTTFGGWHQGHWETDNFPCAVFLYIFSEIVMSTDTEIQVLLLKLAPQRN